jgi:probable rRNA maturation factor
MKLVLVDRRQANDQRPTTEEIELLQRICLSTGRQEWSCDLVLVDDTVVTDLNAQFRHTDGVTDVLSFSYLKGQGMGPAALAAGAGFAHHDLWLDPLTAPGDDTVGEVILAPVFVAEQCCTHGWSYQDEIALLTVHGVLHVLGWSHDTQHERAAMQKLEQELLRQEGIEHPLLKGEKRN